MKCEEVIDRLYIGDEQAATQHHINFDEVVTVGYTDNIPRKSTTGNDFVFPDGDHDYSKFARAVDYTLESFNDDAVVLVHCSRGVSRSAGIITTVISEHHSISLEEAFSKVKSNTEYIDPLASIRDSMEQYTDDELDDFRSRLD